MASVVEVGDTRVGGRPADPVQASPCRVRAKDAFPPVFHAGAPSLDESGHVMGHHSAAKVRFERTVGVILGLGVATSALVMGTVIGFGLFYAWLVLT